MKPLAARMARLGTETAFEVLARAAALEQQGRSIVHLSIGQPDAPTPAHVVEAGIEALRAGQTGYGPTAGLPALREEIARASEAARGVPCRADQVIVTPGGKPVMFYVILALCEPGDEVLYPDPGFPIYRSMIEFCGATPVPVPLRGERRFEVDPDEVASLVTPRTKLLVLNGPNNPTGGILSPRTVASLSGLAVAHDLWVLSDEIYRLLQFEGTFASPLSQPGMAARTVVLDGHSKAYAMTGWRLGHAICPPGLVEAIDRLQVNSVSCTATFTQHAGVAALTGDQHGVAEMRDRYRRRRDHVVARLEALPGVSCPSPGGAFYAFPDVSGTGWESRDLAERLLVEAGVAVLPGDAFGANGRGHLRLSLAASEADLDEGLDRIAAFLGD